MFLLFVIFEVCDGCCVVGWGDGFNRCVVFFKGGSEEEIWMLRLIFVWFGDKLSDVCCFGVIIGGKCEGEGGVDW